MTYHGPVKKTYHGGGHVSQGFGGPRSVETRKLLMGVALVPQPEVGLLPRGA